MSDSLRFRFGPSTAAYLPALVALVIVTPGCGARVPRADYGPQAPLTTADTTLLADRAESWRIPASADDLRGLRLLYDTPVPGRPTLAVVRSVVRSNHRLDPFDALTFAVAAAASARGHRLDYGFFCAMLLQESAFSPDALSSAGAVGIAQFTLDTAADYGLDPFDWKAAMDGSAALLGGYLNAYDGVYPDPYAAALAAYNAGPATVAYYKGVPPYAETRAYVGDVYDRWARIARDTGSSRRGR